MTSLMSALRGRLARAAGIHQIYLRLDQLERARTAHERHIDAAMAHMAAMHTELELSHMQRLSAVESHVLLTSFRHADDAVIEMGEHAVALAALHTEAAVLAAQQTTIDDLRAETLSRVGAARSEARAAVDVVRQEASTKAEQDEFALATMRHDAEQVTALLRRRIDDLHRHLDRIDRSDRAVVATPTTDGLESTAPTVEIEPWMYAALEDAFRGPSDLVAERQLVYVPYIEGSVDASHPLLDLGCGRGEWLTVLRDKGIPARGVDFNATFVDESAANGLEVHEGDLLEALRAAPDASLGAITMFQVLEHLPFPLVVEVLHEAVRVLRPDGVFIAEVPNAKNVRVGSGTFWIDPTHVRPWYPDVLEFVATSSGFSHVDGLYLHATTEAPDLSGVPDNIALLLGKVVQAIDGPADYAVIARR
jgi:SAM-dependent methyltransferase